MITPSFGLTATERVLPRLALDWTAGVAQPGVDVTRAGVATFVGSNGLIQSASADTQRIDWSTGTAGLLVEESRTNLLLNSLINGTSLGTQIVVVTATAHTLSFYGDGSVDLTGAHTATVNGSGAYPTRTTLTFTPSAGALTLTVTGTVQFAQLEAGAFPTSYIPTEASAVTRNADVATMTGTNFSDWFNVDQGTIVCEFQANADPSVSTPNIMSVSDGTFSNRHQHYLTTPNILYRVAKAGVANNIYFSGYSPTTDTLRTAYSYSDNRLASALNGGSVSTITQDPPDSVDRMYVGGAFAGQVAGAFTMRKILYYPHQITDAELQAFSKQG